jgi:hypothetical protein
MVIDDDRLATAEKVAVGQVQTIVDKTNIDQIAEFARIRWSTTAGRRRLDPAVELRVPLPRPS